VSQFIVTQNIKNTLQSFTIASTCVKTANIYLQEKKKKHSRNIMKLLRNSCFVQLYQIIISHEQTGYLLEP
jgi:hypothetical protein